MKREDVIALAREAGAIIDPQWGIASNIGTATFERFASLCRAPLVAEVERLEQWHAEMADNRNAIASERDTLKAELARVQAVAEWQGSADGGKSWRRIDKPRGESIESRVAYLRNMTNSQGRPIYLIRALYTAPQPAAQEPTSAVPVVEMMVEALASCTTDEGPEQEELNRARAALQAGQKFIKEIGK